MDHLYLLKNVSWFAKYQKPSHTHVIPERRWKMVWNHVGTPGAGHSVCWAVTPSCFRMDGGECVWHPSSVQWCRIIPSWQYLVNRTQVNTFAWLPSSFLCLPPFSQSGPTQLFACTRVMISFLASPLSLVASTIHPPYHCQLRFWKWLLVYSPLGAPWHPEPHAPFPTRAVICDPTRLPLHTGFFPNPSWTSPPRKLERLFSTFTFSHAVHFSWRSIASSFT